MEKPKRDIKLLVGYPAAGKTTYVNEHSAEFKGYAIISFDEICDQRCAEILAESGREVSRDTIRNDAEEMKELSKIFDGKFKAAVAEGKNILIDSINFSHELRVRRVEEAKACEHYDYLSTAIMIHAPDENEHVDRLMKRALAEGNFDAVNAVSFRKFDPIQPGEFDRIVEVGAPPRYPLLHEYRKPQPSLVELFGANGKPQSLNR